MMRGFFDESGTHDRSPVTTIAGWIFGTDHSHPCWQAWSAELAAKNMEAFHASEFDHFAKANNWTAEDYEEFVRRLAAILKKYAWFGLAASVITEEYNKLPAWLKKRIGGRYHFCFHVLMHDLHERLRHTVSRLPPLLFFESKDKVIGRTLNDLVAMNNYHLGTLLFADKKCVPLLQTADFLVYEINRWLDDRLLSGKPGTRIQIKELAKAGEGRYKFLKYAYHDAETLGVLVETLESDPDHKFRPGYVQWWPDSWYPNYVKPKMTYEQKMLKRRLIGTNSAAPFAKGNSKSSLFFFQARVVGRDTATLLDSGQYLVSLFCQLVSVLVNHLRYFFGTRTSAHAGKLCGTRFGIVVATDSHPFGKRHIYLRSALNALLTSWPAGAGGYHQVPTDSHSNQGTKHFSISHRQYYFIFFSLCIPRGAF